ncbi:hypothetical protein [Cesiribacter andamanensis]|uniref:Uncharacterized protein n=1 Tax=Cesiribacter andamanensis AMV16 TaxID=1279009 RepID=M7N9R8_9BACT|nr:hypothetical protein [Cesiribacter andamanensis]EMR03951.1 hypothetical protein ADICEAN_00918 [Cesiribacter andamanensis AMV16]
MGNVIAKTIVATDEKLLVNSIIKIFLAVALLLDFSFICLHIIHTFLLSGSINFMIDHEGGYAEYFQYLKEASIVITLVYILCRYNETSFLILTMLFSYVLLDDYFEIHERMGAFLVNIFSLSAFFLLKAQDIGEILVSFIIGGTFILSISYSFMRSKKVYRYILVYYILMFGFLCFFGIGIDMLHSMVGSYFKTSSEISGLGVDFIGASLGYHKLSPEPFNFYTGFKAFGIIIEEGGEMVVMTLILLYTIRLSLLHSLSNYSSLISQGILMRSLQKMKLIDAIDEQQRCGDKGE